MIKINDNTVFVGQIKQLLKEFNLPFVRVYKEETELINNEIYLKDNYLIYYNDGFDELNKEWYIYGKSYLNITKQLKIENLLYDRYTHDYLGNYLRFLRDYKHVDLMSMYNCFNGEIVNNFHVVDNTDFSDDIKSLLTINNNYTIYAIPVKFNQIYSIGLNSSTGCEMFLGIYNEELIHSDGSMINLCNNSYKKFNNCVLNKVKLYDTTVENLSSETLSSLITYEKDLKLFIRVPFNNKSSLVVLEGDYSEFSQRVFETNHLANIYVPVKTPENNINIGKYISDLELLSSNNATGQYVLATRLIEYLTGNVISSISEDYDVKKLQKVLIRKGAVNSDYLGIWSNNDKSGTYGIMLDKFKNEVIPYDSIGYLDKDIEKKLLENFDYEESLEE